MLMSLKINLNSLLHVCYTYEGKLKMRRKQNRDFKIQERGRRLRRPEVKINLRS